MRLSRRMAPAVNVLLALNWPEAFAISVIAICAFAFFIAMLRWME